MEDPAQAAELEKFLDAMKTKSQTKTWENDTDVFIKQPIRVPTEKVNVNVAVKSVKSKKGRRGILIPKVHMKFEDEEAAYFGRVKMKIYTKTLKDAKELRKWLWD